MLVGDRVILRTVRPDELDLVYKLITDMSAKGPYWHLVAQSEYQFRQEYYQNGFWGEQEGRMLIMSHAEEYLGEILYFKGLDYQSGFEVGYELFHSDFQGHGYMSEALMLFCAYMFAIKPINRIQVNVMHGNESSKHLALKCGFVYEGTMRQATFNRGQYFDLELFSLLREECRPLDQLLKK